MSQKLTDTEELSTIDIRLQMCNTYDLWDYFGMMRILEDKRITEIRHRKINQKLRKDLGWDK